MMLVSGKANYLCNFQFVPAEVDNGHRIFYYRYVLSPFFTMLNSLFNLPNCIPSGQGLRSIEEQKYLRLRMHMHMLRNQGRLKIHMWSLRTILSKRKMVYLVHAKQTILLFTVFFFPMLSGLKFVSISLFYVSLLNLFIMHHLVKTDGKATSLDYTCCLLCFQLQLLFVRPILCA